MDADIMFSRSNSMGKKSQRPQTISGFLYGWTKIEREVKRSMAGKTSEK